MDVDLQNDPLGSDPQGRPVYLKDIWPSQLEIQDSHPEVGPLGDVPHQIRRGLRRRRTVEHVAGPGGRPLPMGRGLDLRQESALFHRHGSRAGTITPIENARVLAVLGDSITTDHISPAGSIKPDSPAGRYLVERGVSVADFNSYGARRGNDEVMVRGTFANIRLRNQLAPGTEGGWTRHLPDGEQTTIFDASRRYQDEGVPLMVLAGKEYGSGSSRDWAAKGPRLLGIRAVIAESYERIHRSNLVGMGILPLQFRPGENAESLGLTGEELYSIEGLTEAISGRFASGRELTVAARRDGQPPIRFSVGVRIDTPQEIRYYEHGGILPYVLRQLLHGEPRGGTT